MLVYTAQCRGPREYADSACHVRDSGEPGSSEYSVGLITPFDTLISYEQEVHLLKLR